MALYLAEHIPMVVPKGDEHVSQPTDLEGLARHSLNVAHGVRWLTTFSPDLHDDRHFSLWEAPDGDAIRSLMTQFAFLSDWDVKVFAVRQWGPEDVMSEQAAD